MKIFQKFFSGFVIVALLVTLAGGIIILSVLGVQRSVDLITVSDIPELRAVSESAYHIQRIKSNFRALFLEINSKQRPEEIAYIQAIIKDSLSSLEKYTAAWEDTLRSDPLKESKKKEKLASFFKYKEKLNRFITFANVTEAFCKEDKYKEAQRFFAASEKLLSGELQTMAEDLVNNIFSEVLAKSEKTRNILWRTLGISIALGIIIILFTFIFGYIFSRMITTPLLKIKNAVSTIGKEDGVIPHIDVQSQDEVGVLAKAFNEMSRSQYELTKIKENLTHMLVHDLANPLMIASGMLGLVKTDPENKLSEKQTKHLDTALTAVNDLRRMTRELLEVNKLEKGKLELHYKDIALKTLADEVVMKMQMTPLAEHKTILLETGEVMPPLCADEELTKRVISNLINNALKFTPINSTVSVKVFYQKEEDCFYIQVKDAGPGIPKDSLEKIFKKFVQLEKKGAQRGFGLGLTFCKWVVESHGGRIWAESELDQGSLFTFTLPRKTRKKEVL